MSRKYRDNPGPPSPILGRETKHLEIDSPSGGSPLSAKVPSAAGFTVWLVGLLARLLGLFSLLLLVPSCTYHRLLLSLSAALAVHTRQNPPRDPHLHGTHQHPKRVLPANLDYIMGIEDLLRDGIWKAVEDCQQVSVAVEIHFSAFSTRARVK